MAIRTDYQTVLEIDTATPIAAGQMRADGGDLRVFGDDAHTEALDFYIDPTTLNTTATRIHIKQDLPTGRYHVGAAHYYPLDGDYVDVIDAQNGTPSGTPTEVAGQVGSAYDFDRATPDYVTLPTVLGSELGGKTQLSVEYWIKRSETAVAAGSIPFLINGTTGGIYSKFITFFDASDNLEIRVNTQFDPSPNSITSTSTFTSTTDWIHYVCVCNLSAGRIALYVNGELDVESTSEIWANATWGSDVDKVLISNDSTTNAFGGSIDNLAIYHRELTAEEIRSSYLRGRAGKRLQEPTPTAAWTFNSSDNAGSEVVDLVGGHNGTITGGVTVGQPGRIGQAFDFDGINGVVTVPDSADFNAPNGASGTSTWAATVTWDGTDFAAKTILDKGTATDAFRFGISDVADGIIFDVFSSSGTNRRIFETDMAVPKGVPTHVVMVWDRAQGTDADRFTFYLDGVEVPSSVALSAGSTPTIVDTSASVTIGLRGQSSDLPFNGLIHDLLWSSSVLTEVQIAELARRSKEGLRPDLTDTSLDLLAYWSFDNKDIGIEPQDVIGSNHAIHAGSGSINVGQAGPVEGQAFEFDGASYLEIADDVVFDSHATTSGVMTLAAWVKLNSYTSPQATIISKVQTASNREFWWRVPDGGGLNLQVDTPTGSAFAIGTAAGGNVPLNTWKFVTTVYDASLVADTNDMIRHYVDGVPVVNDSSSNTGGFTAMTSGPAPVFVGSSDDTTPQQFMDGLISTPMYFSEALTADQVRDLYEKSAAGGGASSDTKRVYITYGDTSKTSASSAANTFVREITGLVHAYKFDEPTGGDVLDSSGTENGTVDGYVFVRNGITGLAREMEGEGCLDFLDQIIPPGPASILLSFVTTSSNYTLCSNYNGDPNNVGSALEVHADGYLVFRNSVGAGSNNAFANGSTLVDDGILHTVIVTKDNSIVNVYLDGYAVEATDSMVSAESASATDNFKIGGYTDGTGLASALFDEIRVFNRVLTTNEIGDLMDNYGEPVGSRVQVRKRNDPEPVLNTDL